MNLHNLTPAKGFCQKREKNCSRSGNLDMVELQRVDTKERNQDLVYKTKLVLKVVKCHFKDVFLNSDSKTLIVLNTKRLICIIRNAC
jgi:hypothetical protein